jgi:leucyl-tRNA synthetase
VDQADPELEKKLHRTIAKAGADIERLSFNTAIAAMIEFVNAAGGGVTADQLDRFVRVLAPFAPHIAEELWSKLGREECVAGAEWPVFEESMLKDDVVEVVVQILGKVRSHIRVAADATKDQIEAAALSEPRIVELLEGKTVRKVIVVPGRLVNIVAN